MSKKKQAEVVIYSKDNCPYCVRAEDAARSGEPLQKE